MRYLSSYCRRRWSCVPSPPNSRECREQALCSFRTSCVARADRTVPFSDELAIRARTRAHPPFFDFCLHLFTIWPQVVVKQWDTCEGFTLFAFTLFRVFAFTAAFTAKDCGRVSYARNIVCEIRWRLHAQSTCFQRIVRESPCGEGKKRKLAECVCERARLRARGVAEGEKSSGEGVRERWAVFAESALVWGESGWVFFGRCA